jgi:hypothetical protein
LGLLNLTDEVVMASQGKYERFRVRDPINLEELAEVEPKRPRRDRSKRLHAPGVRFVKGTVPLSVLGQAWRLHHAAPLVLLAIKSEVDIQRWRTRENNSEVTVTSVLCAQLGLSRHARLRGVRALEAAGLISVTWERLRAPLVRLVPGLFDEGKIAVRKL